MCSVIISLLPVKVTGYVTLVIAVKIIRLYNAICSASGHGRRVGHNKKRFIKTSLSVI